MTADDLMKLVNRYTEACDDLGCNLFGQAEAEHNSKHAAAAALYLQIQTEVDRLHTDADQMRARDAMWAERCAKLEADVERYRHLREGKRHCDGAPYVMNPRKSVLYAVQAARGDELDRMVDEDILDVKAHELAQANEAIERGLIPHGMDRFSDEYAAILYELARTELGWSKKRAALAAKEPLSDLRDADYNNFRAALMEINLTANAALAPPIAAPEQEKP